MSKKKQLFLTSKSDPSGALTILSILCKTIGVSCWIRSGSFWNFKLFDSINDVDDKCSSSSFSSSVEIDFKIDSFLSSWFPVASVVKSGNNNGDDGWSRVWCKISSRTSSSSCSTANGNDAVGNSSCWPIISGKVGVGIGGRLNTVDDAYNSWRSCLRRSSLSSFPWLLWFSVFPKGSRSSKSNSSTDFLEVEGGVWTCWSGSFSSWSDWLTVIKRKNSKDDL